jgi:hypothetical protein
MARAKPPGQNGNGTANLGFETKLWLAADKLRNNMDAAEHKHVVLGLIFLKYISNTFEEHRAKLVAGEGKIRRAIGDADLVDWMVAHARSTLLIHRAVGRHSAQLPNRGAGNCSRLGLTRFCN